MYARLEDGALITAPHFLIIGNRKVWNAPGVEYAAQGWMPVILTDPPTTDRQHYAEPSWEIDGSQIIQVWTIVEAEPSPEDILDILVGELE